MERKWEKDMVFLTPWPEVFLKFQIPSNLIFLVQIVSSDAKVSFTPLRLSFGITLLCVAS
jgi:hypothetical protein